MEQEEIKSKLIEVVGEAIPDLQGNDIDTTADLVDVYGVNSIQLIQLILDVEQTFDVSFDDRELALNKYGSFDDVIAKINQKKN